MECIIRAIDPHGPVARIVAIIEIVVNLSSRDEGQLGRRALEDVPLRIRERQRVAILEVAAEDLDRMIVVVRRNSTWRDAAHRWRGRRSEGAEVSEPVTSQSILIEK